MSKYLSNIIIQTILLTVTVVLLLLTICFNLDREILKDILIGVFSSILLLLIFELREYINDKRKYGHLSGSYFRTDIYEVDHTATINTRYKSLNERYKAVNTNIVIQYKGDRQYVFEADYEEGRKKGVIFVDEQNLKIATGHYQYISKKPGYILPDIGDYRFQVDELDNKKIFVFFSNSIPSGLAEGYEVWVRK